MLRPVAVDCRCRPPVQRRHTAAGLPKGGVARAWTSAALQCRGARVALHPRHAGLCPHSAGPDGRFLAEVGGGGDLGQLRHRLLEALRLIAQQR
jgi:hypothetical protein